MDAAAATVATKTGNPCQQIRSNPFLASVVLRKPFLPTSDFQ